VRNGTPGADRIKKGSDEKGESEYVSKRFKDMFEYNDNRRTCAYLEFLAMFAGVTPLGAKLAVGKS